ncbi:hypothetical protein BR93DRAFT_160661 [Coniochaeta sp. PMI_546]|nr:hypothetical protein BR93DRAFT_160661 [Coniochaeta sp. PMI_546]
MSHASGSNQAQHNPRKRASTAGEQAGRNMSVPAGGLAEPAEDSVGDIYVGTGAFKKSWTVHIKRFGDVSPWLKRAFANATTATTEPPNAARAVVELPEVNPRIFDWVHNWIYAVSFSGLKGAPVPAINHTGSPQAPADDDDDDDDDDDLQEVATNIVTPRDLIDLYLLAYKLEIFSLRNAAIDELHIWFHPDAQEKQKRNNATGSRAANTTTTTTNDDDDVELIESVKKQPPFRRVPWLTDVRHVFSRTPEDNNLRRLLISTCVMFIFSKRPQGKKLPEEWKDVLSSNGEIGCAMIKFIASLGWVKGTKDCKDIVIWPKFAFHEGVTKVSLD